MQKRTLTGLIFWFILGFASPLWARAALRSNISMTLWAD